MNYQQNYDKWIKSEKVDQATKEILAHYTEEEKEFRFFAPLSFGTAGLRGTMAPGINGMNAYTVAWATQGFARYILKEGVGDKGIVVGRDSRNNSDLFAKIACEVLAANGIKVYAFDDIRPTPVLSFAVRFLGAAGGINITASHNPKQYNGYKVYWSDGAQISLEQAETISDFIGQTDIFDDVKSSPFEEAVQSGTITMVGPEIDENFLTAVLGERILPEPLAKAADTLKIVYTPLNGAGYRLVPEALRRMGLTHLYTVDEQMTPDGNFPTVPFPNPELPEVFALGIKMAEQINSDLIIANDPDADRLGVMARGKNGFEVLTGNQTGALLLDYIITAYKETRGLPEESYAIKTIVTSELASAICQQNGVTLHNVLTGFKFIGEVINHYQKKGHGSFLFGYEESYGYLKGTHALDKDAVVASVLVCDMAAYYRAKGMTLCDALAALYQKYGFYRELTENIYMEGLDGLARMKALMDDMRAHPPTHFDGDTVTEIRDYRTGLITNLATGETAPTGLPESNVLYYRTDNDNVVVIRPSGTEPKIKVYLLLHANEPTEAEEKLAAYQKVVKSWTA
ncbi:MAG: phospho-sugar mutase [Clostridiales bacterium]|nr:phospho-sugar mutase [Clostridiales bacterium]